jgi:hypothetical protein
VKDLHRGSRGARLKFLPGQLVGDAVIMMVHLDVVIN